MPPKPTGTDPYQGKVAFKPLALPKVERKSLFAEYYYPALGVLFFVVALFSKAAGMPLYDAVVTGLWVAAIVFFASQMIRYLKHQSNPAAEESGAALEKTNLQAKSNAKIPAKASAPPKTLPARSPISAASPTLHSKPYDKPFITPYAKKRLPEIPKSDKKQSQ